MNQVDQAFKDLISKRGIHNSLGVEDNYIQQLRYKMKNDIGISTDLKLELLKKSGWKENAAEYTREDLVKAVQFALKASATAKNLGAEYLVDKWKSKKL